MIFLYNKRLKSEKYIAEKSNMVTNTKSIQGCDIYDRIDLTFMEFSSDCT
jgi:hypothetical protein